MKWEVSYACISKKGLVREVHQDNFLCDGHYLQLGTSGTDVPLTGKIEASDYAVFAVFDGIGGERDGDKAAFTAAKTAAEFSFAGSFPERLNQFCHAANHSVLDLSGNAAGGACGTTMALLQVGPKGVGVANLGDSPIYRLHNHQLNKVTKDHVLTTVGRSKSPLTQYLGVPDEQIRLTPYMTTMPLDEGDIYLLCSDGLTDMVEINQIGQILSENDVSHAADILAETALENGGSDNITIIVCSIVKRTSGWIDWIKNSLSCKLGGKTK